MDILHSLSSLLHRPDPTPVRPPRHPLVLFDPEGSLFLFGIAMPQLAGFLTQQGFPVIQRQLTTELRDHLGSDRMLHQALDHLARSLPLASHELIVHLETSLRACGVARRLGVARRRGKELLQGVLARRGPAVRALRGQIYCAADLYYAPFWPARFHPGLGFQPLFRSSTALAEFLAHPERNPFWDYYERFVLPSLPADMVLAGVSLGHPTQIAPGATLGLLLRRHFPKARVVLGGAFVSLMSEQIAASRAFAACAHGFVTGPGELALGRLYEALRRGEEPALDSVPGLTLWDAVGQAHQSTNTTPFPVDQVATPLYQGLPFVPPPYLYVPTSTGCSWGRCKFCHFPRITYRPGAPAHENRPAEHVWRDLRVLAARHRPFFFWIPDSNVSVAQLGALAAAAPTESEHPIRLFALSRLEAPLADPAFIARLQRAGFVGLFFGLESGSQPLLDRVGKGIRLSTASEVLRRCHEAGLASSLFLVVGLPTETEADRAATGAFVRAHLRYLRGGISIAQFELERHSPMCCDAESWGIVPEPDPEADLDVAVEFHYADGRRAPRVRDRFGWRSQAPEVIEMYARIGIPADQCEYWDSVRPLVGILEAAGWQAAARRRTRRGRRPYGSWICTSGK